MVSELAAAARRLAANGVHVFPLRAASKEPATAHGFQDASTDPAAVDGWWCRWPEANIGVDCGRTGIYVIDLDGPDGAATWRELSQRNDCPVTLTVATAHGHHLWYRSPAGQRMPNTAKRLGPGIDTRGAGGYVLAPPSVHPTGVLYEWRHRHPIADLPAWVAHRVNPPPLPLPRIPARTGGDAGQKLAALADHVTAQGEGRRNDVLFWAACRAVEEGNTAGLAQLVNAAVTAGLPHAEACRTVSSAVRRVNRAGVR